MKSQQLLTTHYKYFGKFVQSLTMSSETVVSVMFMSRRKERKRKTTLEGKNYEANYFAWHSSETR